VARTDGDEIPGSLIDLFIGKRFQARGGRSSFLDAGVLAWTWWMAPSSAAMAAIGSAPIHSRWLGSKLAPTLSRQPPGVGAGLARCR